MLYKAQWTDWKTPWMPKLYIVIYLSVCVVYGIQVVYNTEDQQLSD